VATPEGLVEEDLEGIVRRLLGPKPKGGRQEVGLEDRLDDDLRRRLTSLRESLSWSAWKRRPGSALAAR